MEEQTTSSTLDSETASPQEVHAAEPEQAPAETAFCGNCGAEFSSEDNYCRVCGWDRTRDEMPRRRPRRPLRDAPPISDKKRLTALLLCVILGALGLHRFYVGKNLTGALYLVTFGGLLIGGVYDVIMISTGEFTDSEGRSARRLVANRPRG